MDIQLLTAFQYVLVFLAVWILLFSRRKSAAVNLPPAPKAWPIIGHLHLLGRAPHVSLRKLSSKHGPLMFLRIGSVRTLIVSSSEFAREVLQTHDSVFASRPARPAAVLFSYGIKDLAFSPNNSHWKNVRKLCSMELFTSRRLSSFDRVIREELCQLKSELLRFSSNQLVVTVREPVREFAFNIITRLLMQKAYFGTNRVPEDHVADEFVDMMALVTHAVGEFSVADAFPSLSWLDIKVLKWRSIFRRVDKFLEKILEDHRERKHSGSEDFVDLLIMHFGWDHTDEVKASILDLLLGGTDTTLATIEWSLGELLRNPKVLQRAQAELMNTVGPRIVDFDDIPKLEFMQAIVKEIFRLHPPVPLLLPHFLTQDCKVGNYDIPGKTPVFINAYAIGRDLNVWSDPESFQPERFLGNNINLHGFNFELIPFGAGRRICPGLSLGLKAVQFGLSNLVHLFNWSYPEGVTDHNMEDATGTVNYMASPLKAVVAPRFSV